MKHLRWYGKAALFVAMVLLAGSASLLCLMGQIGEYLLDKAEQIANRIEA
jgi:hypothetical protein